jgi:hypothetical protein
MLEVTTESGAFTCKHDGGRMEIQKCNVMIEWLKDLDKRAKIKHLKS